jgi:hypothetical protein
MLKDTNPKDAVGVRKWRQYCTVPTTIIWELGVAMLEGARKYGRHNYRVAGVRASVYVDAAKGHIDSWWEGEDIDADSGLSHVTKAMASLAVLRDAMINDMLTDDRPPKVKGFESFKANMQKAVESIMERHPDACEPFTELGQQAVRAVVPTITREEVESRLLEERSRATLVAKAGGEVQGTIYESEPDGRCAYVVAHRFVGIEFVDPDHLEFDRMHIWAGLTTKQLCQLVRAEAKDGGGCGMNHESKTGNLRIYRPDQFDGLLIRVVDRISQQPSREAELHWDFGTATCKSRLTEEQWKLAIPELKSVHVKPYHGAIGRAINK